MAFFIKLCQVGYNLIMNKIIIFIVIIILLIGGVYLFLRQNTSLVTTNILIPNQNSQNKIVNETKLKIPENFSIKIFAQGLTAPRVLVQDKNKTLLVSVPSKGVILALPDKDNDGISDQIVTVAENLNYPHGLAFKDNELYVAEENELSVFNYNPNSLTASNKRKLLDLPAGGEHKTRSLLLLPDRENLLISIGSSCNACNEKDDRRAAILKYNLKTREQTTFATGLRNSVFMINDPKTGQILATEMGRDFLGDNLPPDEINAIEEGKFYGWPECYGKNSCNNSASSLVDIPAHSAPLGLARFGEDLLVAYHGSWNRSIPTGYKIVRIHDNEISDFVTGFIDNSSNISGRPVGILTDNQKIYISDDKAGSIYLVTSQ